MGRAPEIEDRRDPAAGYGEHHLCGDASVRPEPRRGVVHVARHCGGLATLRADLLEHALQALGVRLGFEEEPREQVPVEPPPLPAPRARLEPARAVSFGPAERRAETDLEAFLPLSGAVRLWHAGEWISAHFAPRAQGLAGTGSGGAQPGRWGQSGRRVRGV